MDDILHVFTAIGKSKITKIWKSLKEFILLSLIRPRTVTDQVQNMFKC